MSRELSAYALLHWLDVLTHPSGDRLLGFIVIRGSPEFIYAATLRQCSVAPDRAKPHMGGA
jgi:hypothetical protein